MRMRHNNHQSSSQALWDRLVTFFLFVCLFVFLRGFLCSQDTLSSSGPSASAKFARSFLHAESSLVLEAPLSLQVQGDQETAPTCETENEASFQY